MKHLPRFAVIDNACGPGGWARGWRAVTGHSYDILGVDFAKDARDTYTADGFTAMHGDLFQTNDYVRRVKAMNDGERPLLCVGSSSCKGWNPNGPRKGAEDPRDTLVPWIKAVAGLNPVYGAVMENVKQAKNHPDWEIGMHIMGLVGLKLVAMCTLTACDYGAPTSRERTFWVWRRDGIVPDGPVKTPVAPFLSSVISYKGGSFGVDRGDTLEEDTFLCCSMPTSSKKFREKYIQIKVSEAKYAQGVPDKSFCGTQRSVAQQIADIIPPQLTAAVLGAAFPDVIESVTRETLQEVML